MYRSLLLGGKQDSLRTYYRFSYTGKHGILLPTHDCYRCSFSVLFHYMRWPPDWCNEIRNHACVGMSWVARWGGDGCYLWSSIVVVNALGTRKHILGPMPGWHKRDLSLTNRMFASKSDSIKIQDRGYFHSSYPFVTIDTGQLHYEKIQGRFVVN